MRNYKSSYKKYKEMFQAEKKIGNIKHGVRQLTYKQYKDVRNIDKYTNQEIIDKQAILNKQQKKQVWKEYTEIRKELTPGDKAIWDDTYWGKTSKAKKQWGEGLGYHTNLSGLLHSDNGLHFLIANRITQGENADDVLKDYGY